jgi:3-oxoacyl-[acyl-carrier protein] reductase
MVLNAATSDTGMTAERGPALVSGGSRGLGLVIARRLAGAGWDVVIAARDERALDAAAEDAAAEGLKLHPLRADVTSETSVAELFERLAGRGPLRLCVNNAGRNYNHQLVRIADSERSELRPHPVDAWERTIGLCLTGVFLVGRHAAAVMLAAGTPGVIVNISSTVRHGSYGQSAYAAAKAGVESLTRTWAVELGEHGIRVVAVAPGVLDGAALRERSAANPRHAAYMERLRRQVPLQRWCDEHDVADAVAFAADNPSLTGTVLEVDGGGLPKRVYD